MCSNTFHASARKRPRSAPLRSGAPACRSCGAVRLHPFGVPDPCASCGTSAVDPSSASAGSAFAAASPAARRSAARG